MHSLYLLYQTSYSASPTPALFFNVSWLGFDTRRPVVESCRVRSLRKPSEKMSKSDPAELSRISLRGAASPRFKEITCPMASISNGLDCRLVDDPDTVASKIRRAVTDSIPGITYDPTVRPAALLHFVFHNLPHYRLDLRPAYTALIP
jgi:tryptophanyl-tRNA synthetase